MSGNGSFALRVRCPCGLGLTELYVDLRETPFSNFETSIAVVKYSCGPRLAGQICIAQYLPRENRIKISARSEPYHPLG